MDLRARVPDVATVTDGSAAQAEADGLYAWLQSRIGERAHRSSSMADVAEVADLVRVLKTHRHRVYDIVATSEADGSDYREQGFGTPDGGFVGVEEARVLCEHHEEMTPWPCPDVLRLVEQLGGAVADRPAAALNPG